MPVAERNAIKAPSIFCGLPIIRLTDNGEFPNSPLDCKPFFCRMFHLLTIFGVITVNIECAIHDAITQMQSIINALETSLNAQKVKGESTPLFLARKHKMQLAGSHAAQFIASGVPHDQACTRVAKIEQLPVETVAHYVALHTKKIRRKNRDHRNRDIMRRARLGQTNAQIAARWNLSTRQVQRIISACRDSG